MIVDMTELMTQAIAMIAQEVAHEEAKPAISRNHDDTGWLVTFTVTVHDYQVKEMKHGKE